MYLWFPRLDSLMTRYPLHFGPRPRKDLASDLNLDAAWTYWTKSWCIHHWMADGSESTRRTSATEPVVSLFGRFQVVYKSIFRLPSSTIHNYVRNLFLPSVPIFVQWIWKLQADGFNPLDCWIVVPWNLHSMLCFPICFQQTCQACSAFLPLLKDAGEQGLSNILWTLNQFEAGPKCYQKPTIGALSHQQIRGLRGNLDWRFQQGLENLTETRKQTASRIHSPPGFRNSPNGLFYWDLLGRFISVSIGQVRGHRLGVHTAPIVGIWESHHWAARWTSWPLGTSKSRFVEVMWMWMMSCWNAGICQWVSRGHHVSQFDVGVKGKPVRKQTPTILSWCTSEDPWDLLQDPRATCHRRDRINPRLLVVISLSLSLSSRKLWHAKFMNIPVTWTMVCLGTWTTTGDRKQFWMWSAALCTTAMATFGKVEHQEFQFWGSLGPSLRQSM